MKNQNFSNFLTARSQKGNSSQRSLTPTMLIESPKLTLENYKLMIKKSKEKLKKSKNSALSIGINSPFLPSLSETVESTDTCIFSSPIKPLSNNVEELKAQIEEMQDFTNKALEAQKKYFEGIIFDLEQEMIQDKECFYKEICTIKEEIATIREEKNDLSTIFPENSCNWDYKTQYFKNQEFISMLETQNQILYEKIIGNMSETRENK